MVHEVEAIVRSQRDVVTGALPSTLVIITRSRERTSPQEAAALSKRVVDVLAKMFARRARSLATVEGARPPKFSPPPRSAASFAPMNSLQRHYHHGDPHEANPARFYCKAHDSFESREHFDACKLGVIVRRGVTYRETHEWRFVTQRRESFKPERLAQREEGGFRVVDDANNLFRTGTVAEQNLPKLERATR